MMEVVETTGVIRCAKLQSNCHHQHTNTNFVQARCPSCCPTNSVKHTGWKILHSTDLLTPSSHGGLPTLTVTIKSS